MFVIFKPMKFILWYSSIYGEMKCCGFFHLFVHSFHQYLLSTYQVQDTRYTNTKMALILPSVHQDDRQFSLIHAPHRPGLQGLHPYTFSSYQSTRSEDDTKVRAYYFPIQATKKEKVWFLEKLDFPFKMLTFPYKTI